MNLKDRPYFIARLVSWHEKEQHGRIIRAIEKLDRENRDFEITGYYARALNNAGRFQDALDALLNLEEEGKDDATWCFRVGYALYYLNREEEAAEFFFKAIERGDDSEDSRALLQASISEAEFRRKQENPDSLPDHYPEEDLNALESHIETYFGSYRNVFHELESPDIHVDIAVVDPSPGRNYYTLVTMGMGARKMKPPPDMEDMDRAEVMICLPPDWNLDDLEDERWYWPIRWLKILARLPINEDAWLGWGHTIPNGEPFADNTKLCTILLLNPGAFGERAAYCPLSNGERINFYQMIPLYEEETQFKINNNVQILLNFLDQDALEYVRIDRENICGDAAGA
ncbi:MAG: suppressor of fused domain protein [Treponema sp.]|jgi:tetratricopeptide (TPR) repeat protein|nr:suppressor of fused domain protein [Treponema sp.]